MAKIMTLKVHHLLSYAALTPAEKPVLTHINQGKVLHINKDYHVFNHKRIHMHKTVPIGEKT